MQMALRLRKLDIEIRRERQEKEKNLRAQLMDENERIKVERETMLEAKRAQMAQEEQEWDEEEYLREWDGEHPLREVGEEVVDDVDLDLEE